MLAPSEAFRAADGRYIVISPTGQEFWKVFCTAIARPDLAADERFATPEGRIENVVALSQELSEVFARRDAQDWLDDLDAARVPAAPVLSVDEALAQPLALLRGMVETVPQTATGQPLRLLGNPFKVGPEPVPTLGYPPGLGEDTRAVLAEVCGYSTGVVDQLLESSAVFAPSKPVGEPTDPGADERPAPTEGEA